MNIKNINIFKPHIGRTTNVYYDVTGIKSHKCGKLTVIHNNDIVTHVSVIGKDSCANLPLNGENTDVLLITDENNEIIYQKIK